MQEWIISRYINKNFLMKNLQYVDIHEMYLIFQVKVIHVHSQMNMCTEVENITSLKSWKV
jgi:hypothetical protein